MNKKLSSKKIAILGGGITGLSLAWHLQKQSNPPLKITLYEASTSVGGVIQTDCIEGAFYEWGPHTLRLSSPYQEICERLIKDLDLLDQVLTPKGINKKYLGYNNKLHPLPSHPLHLFKPKIFKSLVFPLLKEPLFQKHIDEEDPSIETFFSTRYSQNFCDSFIDPIVTGIFGGDMSKLSMAACFPHIYKHRQAKSLLVTLLKEKKKSPSKMITFKKGLSQLIQALKTQLNIEFKLGTKVSKVSLRENLTVFTNDQQESYDFIFSCLPAEALKHLFPSEVDIRSCLQSFNALSYKVVHLGFSKPLNLPQSFGFLSPSWSDSKLQGVIFDSFVTPSHNSKNHPFRLTVLLSKRSSLFSLPKEALLTEVKKELSLYLGEPVEPHYENLYAFKDAITQYEVGHLNRLKHLRKLFKNKTSQFAFGGKSFTGGSVPACIYEGKQLAEVYLRNFQTA